MKNRLFLVLPFLIVAVEWPTHAAAQDTSATSYERLAESSVATALQLTDTQKASIATILAERATAEKAAADDAATAQANTVAEQKLRAVLTAAQRAQFTVLFGEPRLKFNFRLQKWGDVLDYIADEAGLSLVMDDPPPGVFNYSDSKEYTPTEAIDLVNGWLLTKGFTLVRRERLLMCLPLKDGLPDASIPRVPLDKLNERGRFEFVRVLVPLEGRPATETLAEIKPLLGTYGKAELLAATQQLIVTDAAGTVKTIAEVVQKVPLPKKAKPPAPKPKPKPKPPAPKPTLIVYPTVHANPQQAGEVLKKMLSGTILVDETANQISINAVPDEHKKAEIILKQLETNQGPDKQPILKLHPARFRAADDTDEIIATLKLVAPEAQFRFDQASRQLVTLARPAEHEQIQRSLEQLATQRQSEPTNLEVYPLTNIDPDAASELVQSLLPEMRVTVDNKTKSLIAVGSRADHVAITALLQQMRPQVDALRPDELKSYAVDPEISEAATSVLAGVVPEATVTTDAPNKRLLIVAPAEKHEFIANTLQQLSDNLAPADQTLKSYDARGVDTTSVLALLETLAPTAKITSDTANERLLVIGAAKDHTAVENVMTQVARDESGTELKSYPLQPTVDVTTATNLLTTITPDAAVTVDAENRRLLVTARPPDHEKIVAALAQITRDAGGEIPELQFYQLKNATGKNAVQILTKMLPAAQLTLEESERRLSAVATKREHEILQATLNKLEASSPPNEKRTLKIYDVSVKQSADFSTMLTSLAAELPGLQVLTNATPGEMTVWAKPSQHVIVDQILSQLKREIPADQKPKLIVYPINSVDPTSVSTVLTELFPDAKITVDNVANRLLIHAKPDLQTTIKSAIEQLDSDTAGQREIKLMVYPARNVNATTALQLLTDEVPRANVIHDTTGETLIVRARLADQQRVAALLDSLKTASAPLTARTVVVYPSAHQSAPLEKAFFENAFPDATFLVDQTSQTMTALATAGDHEKIRRAVTEKLTAKKRGAELKSYATGDADQDSMLPLLNAVVDDAEFVFADRKLLAWATADDHAQIERIVSGLVQPNNERTIAAFDVSKIGPTAARSVLAELSPETNFLDGDNQKSLIAWVDANTKTRIETALQQLSQSPAAGQPDALRFYPVRKQTSAAIQSAISAVLPEVTFTPSADGSQLMAFVTDARHKQIQDTLQQIETAKPFHVERKLQFYDIESAGKTNAQNVLTSLLPDVNLSVVDDGRRLMGQVSSAEHAEIERILGQLRQEKPFAPETSLKLYSVRDLGETATTVLENAVPGAAISAGATPDQIAVVATDADHTKLTAALETLSGSRTSKKSLAVYDIHGTSADAVQEVLEPLIDDQTQLTVDSTGRRLFVRATKDRQDAIQETVQQVMAGLQQDDKLQTTSYYVGAPNADEAQEVLEAMFPDATLVTDRDQKMLVATATPEQHKVITTITKQFAATGTLGSNPYPVVYSAKNMTAVDLESIIDDLYTRFDNVKVAANEKTGGVVAIAREEQHATIKSLIEEFDGQPVDDLKKQLAVYRVIPLDGLAVKTALEPLVSNNVTISAARRSNEILVSAPADEQAAIAKMVDQIVSPAGAAGVETKTYRLLRGEADDAQTALQALFPSAVLVTDLRRQILVATATPEQHKTIDTVVKQMTGNATSANSPTPKTYRLNSASGDTVIDVLEDLFDSAEDVRLSLDEENQTIVAIARGDQHKTIQNLLLELDPKDGASVRNIKMYPLEERDGNMIRQVVSGILLDKDPSATVVYEGLTRNLLVTTTADGHELAKETIARFENPVERETEVFQLAYLEPRAAQSAIDRLISSRAKHNSERPQIHADEDLQQLWVQASPEQLTNMRTLLVKMGEVGLQKTTAAGNSTRNLRTIRVDNVDAALQRIEKLWPSVRKNPLRVMRPGKVKQIEPQPSRAQFSIPPENPQAVQTEPAEENNSNPSQLKTETPQQQKDSPSAPVVLIPGDGRLTIASDDVDALDQMESLLRVFFSQPAGLRNRDFSVYQIDNTGASDVATTLQQIFDSAEGLVSFGQVALVPDERLNALIVYASRTDRGRIEQLISILDSEKDEDTRRAYQTEVVTLEYAAAERIEDVLGGVYKAQLSAGGARSSVAIPKGVPSEVATVLRQINAAASAPLLTIEAQEETNSLVIKAPRDLLEEVTNLVSRLDESAKSTRASGIRLLQLKKTNARRVMKTLGEVLD